MKIYSSKTDEPLVEWQWYEPSLRNITHLVVKAVPKEARRVLDVGCGTGRVSFALAQRGHDVTGIDAHERVVSIAKRIAEHQARHPRFQVVDFRDPTKVEPDQYDVVVCSEVLEHIDEYRRVIANIYAALKPGGHVIVTVPCDPRKWSVLDEYGGHVRRFTISQIRRDLDQFTNVRITVTGFPFYRLLVRVYLAKISLFGQEHSNEVLWQKRRTKWISALLYPLMRLDNDLAFTRLGDSLIAVADKH